MHIARLALDHYRSWEHCVLDLEPGVTVLLGANGLGKTNLVEAIEVVATGASHRTSTLAPLIARGASSATIRVNVAGETGQDDASATTYEVTLNARGANRGRINGGPSRYMRNIVGRIACVTFAPEDQRLVAGDPASRRMLLNQAGVLLAPEYATLLQECTHIAKQRSALLKQLAHSGDVADDPGRELSLQGLEIWTGQFIEAGVALTRLRAAIVERLREPFSRIYADLAGRGERAELQYAPSFDEVLLLDAPEAELSRHFQRLYPGEVARGQNLIGPQRDDMDVLLNGMPAREYASNGEMWTLALALKMAIDETVGEERGVTPIVILDDVFAQLDDSRRGQIMEFARERGQVLITAASVGDIPRTISGGDDALRIIDVGRLAEEQAAMHDPAEMARRFAEQLDTERS